MGSHEKGLILMMLAATGIAIGTRIAAGIYCGRLAGEARRPVSAQNPGLRAFLMEFEAIRLIRGELKDPKSYIERYIHSLSLGRVPVRVLVRISSLAQSVSVLLAGIGICEGLAGNRGYVMVLPFYSMAFLTLYLYFFVVKWADVKGSLGRIRVGLLHYLRNTDSGANSERDSGENDTIGET